MKKTLLLTTLFYLFSNVAFAVIEEAQEVKTSKATYSCKRKNCDRISGDVEIDVEFQYTLITTSNSGKSSTKKKYNCKTTQSGATCRAIQ
ncbi:hypothetical protein HDR60_04420 [bacterium]|nr:hypothetical protein [bacterium]MDE6224334.1 hypothetical protein [Alphaproteobacteria bacterium]